MHIAFAASECVPFSKTGGLADVIGALPPALASLGHQVTVFLPRYQQTKLDNPRTVIPSITVRSTTAIASAPCSTAANAPECNSISSTIRRSSIATDSMALRWATITIMPSASRCSRRAVLEATKILGAPDVLHCHDWQTALIPILLKTLYDEDPAFADTPLRLHHSQPGISGTVSARNSCRCSCCPGTCSPCRSWNSTAR